MTYIDQAEAMTTLTWFGRCYGKKNRIDALSIIATEPGSLEERRTFKKLFRGSSLACMAENTNLRMPLPYVRGVIVEGVYRTGAGVPATHALVPKAVADVRSLTDAALCYTPAHRGDVQKLLGTKHGSKAEFEAVAALMEELGKCMPADGAKQFDATWVRFRLAEALLRLPPAAATTTEQ